MYAAIAPRASAGVLYRYLSEVEAERESGWGCDEWGCDERSVEPARMPAIEFTFRLKSNLRLFSKLTDNVILTSS